MSWLEEADGAPITPRNCGLVFAVEPADGAIDVDAGIDKRAETGVDTGADTDDGGDEVDDGGDEDEDDDGGDEDDEVDEGAEGVEGVEAGAIGAGIKGFAGRVRSLGAPVGNEVAGTAAAFDPADDFIEDCAAFCACMPACPFDATRTL